MASKKSSKKKKKGGSSSSKDEKKALKQTKQYYEQKKADINTKAATDTTRLAEDLTRIMAESGLGQNRATEDYIRNIGNIESNKGLDVAQLTDYVSTNTGRTKEDLNTALAKETRRFTLESDQINQNLADTGQTFSSRVPERIAQTGNAMNLADINTEATRSFQDIARYETAKNAEIQNRYGQQTEQATTAKSRTLEDILNEQQQKAQQIQRGQQDVAFGKAINIRDTNYNAADAASTIGNAYDTQANKLKTATEEKNVLG